jgi:TPP-dependent pyruvate/acetoin dehydrogenase alpha subunit
LLAAGAVSEAGLAEIEKEVGAAVDDAVAFAEASPTPDPTDTLRHVYCEEAA